MSEHSPINECRVQDAHLSIITIEWNDGRTQTLALTSGILRLARLLPTAFPLSPVADMHPERTLEPLHGNAQEFLMTIS